MTQEGKSFITVSGLRVEVVHKAIKNLHLGVYPPDGHIRVAAPLSVDSDAVRMAVLTRLGWIKRQRSKFKQQPRQSTRQMVTGESHYVFGRRLRLTVEERPGRQTVELRGKTRLHLCVRPGSTTEARQRVLDRWYRQQLHTSIEQWLGDWEKRLRVKASAVSIRKMKTKWGSCNPVSGRILLNLELAKTPETCIEYVLVHELAHLQERHHNSRFLKLLEQHLPEWQGLKATLAKHPLCV